MGVPTLGFRRNKVKALRALRAGTGHLGCGCVEAGLSETEMELVRAWSPRSSLSPEPTPFISAVSCVVSRACNSPGSGEGSGLVWEGSEIPAGRPRAAVRAAGGPDTAREVPRTGNAGRSQL